MILGMLHFSTNPLNDNLNMTKYIFHYMGKVTRYYSRVVILCFRHTMIQYGYLLSLLNTTYSMYLSFGLKFSLGIFKRVL